MTGNEKERGVIIVCAGHGKLAHAIATSACDLGIFTATIANDFDFELRKLDRISRQTAFTITELSDNLQDLHYIIDESLNALSLKKLRELMFIPVKVQINRSFNPKNHNLTIRNQLPQRIRINEKAE